jgi:hypothetical protein
VRGMEFYRGRLVAYSAGNFVGYRTLSSAGLLGVTCLIRVTLGADGRWVDGAIVATAMTPPGVAAPDPQRRALGVIARLSALDFGRTAARLDPDGRIRRPSG